MDLSFTRFDRAFPASARAHWAVLLACLAAQQAASRTAAIQALLPGPATPPDRFAPSDGRFSATGAALLAEWKGG